MHEYTEAMGAYHRDLARMRGASEYALAYLAVHLHNAGEVNRLCQLLVDNRAWMEVKYERTLSHAGYAADLTIAISDLKDPLDTLALRQLFELRTANAVVNTQVQLDTDIDLSILCLLGREYEALEIARLRPEGYERLEGVLVVEGSLRESGRPDGRLVDELKRILVQIRTPWQRGFGSVKLVRLLREYGRDADAQELAYSIEYPPARLNAMCDLAEARLALGIRDDKAVADALRVARGICDGYDRAKALGDCAVLLFRLNDAEQGGTLLEECVETVQKITKRSEWQYAVRDFAINLAKAGLVEDGIQQADEINDALQTSLAMKEIGKALVSAGENERALDLFRRIPELEQRVETLITFADHLPVENRNALLAEAETLAASIPSGKQRSVPWAELAGAWEEVAHRADADRCLSKAWELASTAEEHDRDQALFTTAAAYIHGCRFEEALSAVEKVEGGESRRYLLRDLAYAVAKRGEKKAAAEIFEEARRQAASLQNEYRSGEVRNAISKALLSVGRLAEARSIAHQVRDKFWRDQTWKDIAGYLARAGRFEDAISVTDQLENGSERDEVFEVLAQSSTDAGDVTGAVSMARKIVDPEQRTKQLDILVGGLANKGMYTAALELAGSFQDDDRFVNPVGTVGISLLRAGKIDRALKVIRGIKNRRKQWWAFRESSVELARRGRVKKALSLVRSIPDSGVRKSGMEGIAEVLLEGKKIDEALAVAQSLPWSSRAKTIATAAEELAGRGKFDEAIAAAESVPKRVRAENGVRVRDIAMGNVADALAVVEPEKALQLSERISAADLRRNVADAVAIALIAAGRIEESTALASGNGSDDYTRDTSIAGRVEALAKCGREREAFSLVNGIADPRTRGEAELRIVAMLIAAGRVDAARSASERIMREEERAKAFLLLADRFTSEGRINDAIRVSADNPGMHERAQALSDIATVLVRERRFADALDALAIGSPDGYVQVACEWSEQLESMGRDGFHTILTAVLRVAAWQAEDWNMVASVLA